MSRFKGINFRIVRFYYRCQAWLLIHDRSIASTRCQGEIIDVQLSDSSGSGHILDSKFPFRNLSVNGGSRAGVGETEQSVNPGKPSFISWAKDSNELYFVISPSQIVRKCCWHVDLRQNCP